MASGLNSTVLSKYTQGSGLVLLHRKEHGPGKQAGKREEPGGVHQKWAWAAQAGAHGCRAPSRGSGKCHSGKSHGEIGLRTPPSGTQSSCSMLSPLVCLRPSFLLVLKQSRCGASSRQPVAAAILMTTCPSVLCALVAVQEGVNCSFTWRHILYFRPWVHVLNVISASVACLSETLYTSPFLC